MKKIKIFAVAAMALMMGSCGMGTTSGTTADASAGSVLGSILTAAANPETAGNVLQSVLGLDKVTQASLVGTWSYNQPGCAFTSKNLLAQAGGEVAATSIKQKLAGYYQTAGISSGNTQVTLNQDGTFTAKIAGKSWQGKWTFDEANYKITMQGLLLSINCYAKKNTNGIGLLFEGKKLLTMLQTMATLSGNQTAQSISDLSKNYDGLRIGFDMTK
jgi:hypothetical protein